MVLLHMIGLDQKIGPVDNDTTKMDLAISVFNFHFKLVVNLSHN